MDVLYLFTFDSERFSPSQIQLLSLISGGRLEGLRNSVCLWRKNKK